MQGKLTRRHLLKLGLVAAGSVALAACAPKPTPTPEVKAAPTTAPTAKPAEPTKAPPTTAPTAVPTAKPTAGPAPTQDVSNKNLEQIKRLSDKRIVLKGWAPQLYNPVADIKSWSDQLFFKKMAELTNVEIQWTHASPDPGVDALAVLMASGDLPDFIVMSPGNAGVYGMQGALEPLNDWINTSCPYFGTFAKKNREILGSLTAPDGKIYAFPRTWEDRIVGVFAGFIMRLDWLQEVGMKMPETTDQFYEALKAFKQKDPKRYPYTWDPRGLIWQWGVGAAGPNNGTWFYRDGDAIKFGPIEPHFQEAIAYLNKLWKEGLLDPEYEQTMSQPDFLQQRMTTGISGCMLGYGSTHLNPYIKTLGPGKIGAMLPPKGPYGDSYMLSNHGVIDAGQGGSIAKTSKYKEILAQYIDLYYSDSGVALMNWGVYGDTYIEENGVRKYTDKVIKNPNLSKGEYMWNYVSPNWMGPMLMDVASAKAGRDPEAWAAIELWAKSSDKIKLPILYFTKDEQAAIKAKMTDINTLIAETVTQLIKGTKSLDKDYPAFVNQVLGMGIRDVLKIYQTSYERFLAGTKG